MSTDVPSAAQGAAPMLGHQVVVITETVGVLTGIEEGGISLRFGGKPGSLRLKVAPYPTEEGEWIEGNIVEVVDVSTMSVLTVNRSSLLRVPITGQEPIRP